MPDWVTSFFSSAGRFESYLIENPEDRFSHDEDHLKLLQLYLAIWPQHCGEKEFVALLSVVYF